MGDRKQNKLWYLPSKSLYPVGVKKICTWLEHRQVKLSELDTYVYLVPSWDTTKMRVKELKRYELISITRMGEITTVEQTNLRR